jgi:ATP adenylyltransferase
MDILYAPWRSIYVKKNTSDILQDTTKRDCVFCTKLGNNDADGLILRRSENTIVMLNLYPYNAGHLLILPRAHARTLNDVSPETRTELIELVNQSIELLTSILKATGMNVGFNLGDAGGASIPEHLHMHVLPRWIGDTNFLPLLAQTKQISIDLLDLYQQLKPHFEHIVLSGLS